MATTVKKQLLKAESSNNGSSSDPPSAADALSAATCRMTSGCVGGKMAPGSHLLILDCMSGLECGAVVAWGESVAVGEPLSDNFTFCFEEALRRPSSPNPESSIVTRVFGLSDSRYSLASSVAIAHSTHTPVFTSYSKGVAYHTKSNEVSGLTP